MTGPGPEGGPDSTRSRGERVGDRGNPRDGRHLCLVDAHVHFHQPGLVGPTLDAAASNFRAVSGRSKGLLGAILLAQGVSERVFETLESTPAGGWTIAPAPGEPESQLARQGGMAIAIVCGRQVRAGDGLEVLALGTRESFQDGQPFASAVEAVCRSGALTTIPWGFGKWRGSRRQRMIAMLRRLGPGSLFLGDNGARLGLLPRPALIGAYERLGFRVLPGSDPFPLAGDYRRVGRTGFIAEVEVPETAPWQAIRAWLLQRSSSPPAFGGGSGTLRFLVNQIGIQAHKRLARSGLG